MTKVLSFTWMRSTSISLCDAPSKLFPLIAICVVFVGCTDSETNTLQVQEAQQSLDAAFGFLYSQMDRYHGAIIIADEPEYQQFYPSGIMGDQDCLSIDPASREFAYSGETSTRIEYDPTKTGTNGWAGLYFQYPSANWGTYRGRNLKGAKSLTFWVRSDQPIVAEFLSGGIAPSSPSHGAYSDSFGPLRTGPVKISDRWQRFDISLEGQDLSSVIGSFAYIGSRSYQSQPHSIYLDAVTIDVPRLEEPRFIQSYHGRQCESGAPLNSCHVYDQALVLLAFLARGTPDDLRRADIVARALVQAQNNDRYFRDGRLRNVYASGEIVDPSTGLARIPGSWRPQSQQFFEDEFAVGSDTGNLAWAGLALIQAHSTLSGLPNSPFLQASVNLGEWIVANVKMNDSLGGFSGGFEGFEGGAGEHSGQYRSTWRSTEHNIDLVAFFEHLAQTFGREEKEGRYWVEQARHARFFLSRMLQDEGVGFFLLTGTEPGSQTLNRVAIPLDTQAWSVLALQQPRRFEPALDWALTNCVSKQHARAFDFNCNDGDGAWWEGTAQVATALKELGRNREADKVLQSVRDAQVIEGTAAGAVPAASKCGLTTGFSKFWRGLGKDVPWVYTNQPHVGATAWYIFGLLGVNPYDISRRLPSVAIKTP